MTADDLQQRLFRAARGERPASDLGRQIIEAAGRGSGALPKAPPSRARWRVAGTIAGLAALAAGATLVLTRPPPGSDNAAITAERFVPVAPPEARVARRPEPRLVAPAAPTGSRAVPPRRLAPLPSTAEPRALPEQLALLKRARAALRSGQAARALQLLDEYGQRPNRVDMSAEATLLRIEALAGSGQRDRAAAFAKRFVGSNPNSPLADRARSFMNSAESSQGEAPHEHGVRPEKIEVRSEDGQRQQPDGRVNDEE